MDKKDSSGKKLVCKKSVVRNTVQKLPKTVVVHQSDLLKTQTPTISNILEEPPSSEIIPESPQKSAFQVPELNTGLKLVKQIESLQNLKLKKAKSVPLTKTKRIVLEEKASKQVNFPYNQPIYKDLMPLCVRTQPPQLPSKEIIIQKEKEPLLSDFFVPKRLPEYKFQVPTQTTHKALTREFDGLKLYKTIRNWN